MAKRERELIPRTKPCVAFCVSSGQISPDQARRLTVDAGFKDVTIEGDVVHLNVPEDESLEIVRKKLSSSWKHRVLVLPEVTETCLITINDDWLKTVDSHGIKLETILYSTGVNISSDRKHLTGSRDDIDRAIRSIEIGVRNALSPDANDYRTSGDDNGITGVNGIDKKQMKLNGTDRDRRRPDTKEHSSDQFSKVGNGMTKRLDDFATNGDRNFVGSEVTERENGVREMKGVNGAMVENGNDKHERKDRLSPSDSDSDSKKERRQNHDYLTNFSSKSEELKKSKKSELASIKIGNCQLQFIKQFYPDVYKFIGKLRISDASIDDLVISGSPDDIKKLSDWFEGHDIHRVVRHIDRIPSHISAKEFTAIHDSNVGKWKLMVKILQDVKYEVIGSLKDIQLFLSEIEKRVAANVLMSSQMKSSVATSNGSKMGFEFRLPRSSIEIVIAKGDLTKQDTDAIVSPSNSSLRPYGGASKAIADAAGSRLIDECKDFIRSDTYLRTSGVMHTSAGRMNPPVKYVIHACGPIDTGSGSRKLKQDLEKTFVNCFKLATELRVKSLSVPAISSGVFRVKKDLVAECTWNALMLFDDEISDKVSLRKILLVNIDSEATKSLIETFRRRLNELRFHQQSKVEAAQSEKSGQSQTKLRRSGSFSGSISSLKSESGSGERGSTKTAIKEDKSVYSVDTNVGRAVPKIKGSLSTYFGGSSETKCCVCNKQKPSSYLMQHNSCRHKCCPPCLYRNCLLCMNSRKPSSGSHPTRILSSPSEENDETSFTGSQHRPSSVYDVDQPSDSDVSRPSPVKTDGGDGDDCCICMDTIKNAKKLDCGHTFCRDCIEKAFLHQPKCPSCGKIFGLLKGSQPDGTMTVKKDRTLNLSGYYGDGAIIITYDIPDGVQTRNHPNPGQKYRGTHRMAYLPGNAEGEEVLHLLSKAFEAKLIFTIGRSNTTGRDNVAIWNDIHHKTSVSGQYGYPDLTYLKRVKEELAAKGIKPEPSSSSAATRTSADLYSADRYSSLPEHSRYRSPLPSSYSASNDFGASSLTSHKSSVPSSLTSASSRTGRTLSTSPRSIVRSSSLGSRYFGSASVGYSSYF